LTHYTAFENQNLNRLAALMTNIPTLAPSAITFGKYHWEHHQNMGNPDCDADLPTVKLN
jgi:sphingolipid 4-desaturase/C4-monooxygenase